MFNDAVQNKNGYQIPGTSEEKNERIIAAPFVAEGKVLGAICLNRIGPYFTKEDLALADTFANYAATAIKNAQTYQKLQHEIEERNLAEKAHRESEKRYKDLQANIPVSIFRATPQGKLLAVNPTMFKMFGYESEKEFRTVSTTKLYSQPKDRIRLMEELRSKGEIHDFEVELLKKNKTVFWCSLSIKTVKNEKEEWIYQDGMITDISERKISELTHNVLFNIGNAVNSTKDLQEFFKTIHHELAKIIRTNNFYIALYDKSSNLISSPYYVDQYNKKTPPQQELRQGLTAYVIRTGKSLFLDKKKRDELMKDGVIANYKWKSKLWLGAPLKINNEVIGAMAVQSYENEKAFEKKDLKVLEFVSDQVAIAVHRKRAEEALLTSEQLNRTVIDNSPLGISVRNKNGMLLIANKAWKKIWSKTKKRIESEQQKKIFLNFDKRDQYLGEHLLYVKKVYKEGGEYYIPELKVTSNNKTKWISHYFYAIQDRDSRVDKVVILTEDITQRKQAEEKLLKTQLRLATLFKYVPNIILYETGGKQEFMSENIIDLLGFPAKDFIEDKNKFTTLIHPEDHEYIKQKYKEWEKSGKKDLLTLWFRVKKSDGSYMWIEDRMVEIVPENEKTYYAGVKIDISNLKKSEEELKDSYKKLQRLLEETINGLVSAVEMRDPYTAGHQRRVATLAADIAREMGLSKDQVDGLNLAALVHDIGKINVPAEILSKPGKLTPAEFNLIKMHPQTGFDILKSIEFPWPVAEVVLQHQERLDGSSYPQGLKGDEISLNARILSVADVIEAMSSHRPYRPSLGIDVALDEIKKNRGILYDPDVVDACMILFNEKGFKFPEEENPESHDIAN
jgi:PAS domain S-box-containing protein/putative nucleotidyltransferase with HDIG domain